MILNIEAIGLATSWLDDPNVAKKAQITESISISIVYFQGKKKDADVLRSRFC